MIPIHTKYEDAETFDFPGAITLRLLLSGKDTDGNMAIFEDIVEPGIGPGRHIHHKEDEVFMFLEGDFVAEVGGKMFEFKPGDVAFIPKGTIHAFKNVGSTKGRLRYVFSPANAVEDMFRDFYALQESGTFNEETMKEVSLKHGQEMVGPPL